MIVDTFLFFQELDLLDIRLEYLYPVVDKFIILEACQSFRGNPKEYVFEKNIKRYSKFIDKIEYLKIEQIYYSYYDLADYLENSNCKINNKINNFIRNHKHYDKNNLSHLLDSFHRECLHIGLKKICRPNDIVILSDLDEIPLFNVIRNIKKENFENYPKVFIQHEFQYFLNNYSNSNWYGSIICPYRLLSNISLNEMRLRSINFTKIANGGYHFTSIGNLKSIKNKIENWGHPEFDHKLIINNIEKNISHGKDIFYRFKRYKNKAINFYVNDIVDERMLQIIIKFNKYFIKKIHSNIFYDIKYFYFQILFNFSRAISNPKKLFRKILIILSSK